LGGLPEHGRVLESAVSLLAVDPRVEALYPATPFLGPRFNLPLVPNSASPFSADRRWEGRIVESDFVGALPAHTEQVGDLNEAYESSFHGPGLLRLPLTGDPFREGPHHRQGVRYVLKADRDISAINQPPWVWLYYHSPDTEVFRKPRRIDLLKVLWGVPTMIVDQGVSCELDFANRRPIRETRQVNADCLVTADQAA
jgi:hypothetical protein